MLNDTGKTSDGIRVLVCGSHRFMDREFVYGMLNGCEAAFDISAVVSGNFSGTDAYAKAWAETKGIKFEQLDMQDADKMRLSFFDSKRQIPEIVIKNDPMYRSGFEKMRDAGVQLVLAIPNPEGELGANTACLIRMAGVLGIEALNGADALGFVSQKLEEAAAMQATAAPNTMEMRASARP